jgi:cytochrome P450
VTTTAPDAPYLDTSDPSFSTRSEEVQAAREQSWYARTNYGIAVLRYDEVSRLIKDPRLRGGLRNWPAANGVAGPWAEWWTSAIGSHEGADHDRLRRLLKPAFSRTLISGLVPRFQGLANELIDGFIDRRRCEFMSEFAEPYAARVIAIMLGLPESEWKQLAEWSATLGLGITVKVKESLGEIEEALERLYEYADEIISDRERHPKDDFMTRLVQAQYDEDGLSRDELRVHVVFLIFGGMDTTRKQLGLALETFIEHPAQWELLAHHPELGGAAVEEVMRVSPTATWVSREALEDFEFQGLEIEAGTVIYLFSSSAGTDPRAFGQPGLDITAERAPHFGFGGGVHHCIGSFVARTDMSVALPLLARRLKDPRIEGEVRSLPGSSGTGPIELPIAFTPSGPSEAHVSTGRPTSRS